MKNKDTIHQQLQDWRKPILFFGMFLSIIGVLLLLYLGFLVVQIIHNPTEIPIVAVLLNQLKNNEAVISGFLGTEKIDIHLSEPLKFLLFLIFGAAALSICAGVAQVLLKNGIAVMQFAAKPSDDAEQESQ